MIERVASHSSSLVDEAAEPTMAEDLATLVEIYMANFSKVKEELRQVTAERDALRDEVASLRRELDGR